MGRTCARTYNFLPVNLEYVRAADVHFSTSARTMRLRDITVDRDIRYIFTNKSSVELVRLD